MGSWAPGTMTPMSRSQRDARGPRSIVAPVRERDRYLRYGVRMRLGLTIVAALVCGCSAAEDAGAETDDFIDMDTPPGNCSAGTTGMPCPDPGTTGAPVGGPCLDSADCAEGWCVAPFTEGEVGSFTCIAECIPLMDESMWCLDASACCEPGAVCSARGLCVEGGLDDSGTASSGTASGTASDGTASDGTASDGTASDGSGTSSGSDTGSSTGTTGAMGGR